MTLLAACGESDVALDPPTPTGSAKAACTALSKAWPSTVLNQATRTVTPTSPMTKAWGDPSIGLRCGVTKPQTLVAGANVFAVNGVDWFAEELTNGTLFTTVGRVANVEVSVPTKYRPEAEALIDLEPAIKKFNPLVSATP